MSEMSYLGRCYIVVSALELSIAVFYIEDRVFLHWVLFVLVILYDFCRFSSDFQGMMCDASVFYW